MNLTRELLLTYQGLNGFDGLCPVRIYEQPGQLPIVIAGALDDNPGTSITNAVSMVAAAVQHNEFSDGREFRLVEHAHRACEEIRRRSGRTAERAPIRA